MTLDEMIAVLTAAKEGKNLVSTLGSPIAQGHNPDKLTEEQVGVKDGWRTLSCEERMAIQDHTNVNDSRCKTERWEDGRWNNISYGNSEEATYRTKQPPGYFLPKPTEKKPLGPEDFPPGTVVRFDGQDQSSWHSVIEVCPAYIRIGTGNCLGLHPAFAGPILQEIPGVMRSIDGGKTWLPCYKEE